MLNITPNIAIPLNEIDISAVRAQGAGGQNVNKVSSAIHLRFDINAATLPDELKARLLRLNDHRITKEGVVVIKAQEYRSQDQNREAALQRLAELVRRATIRPKRRRPSRPSRKAKEKRLESKTRRGRIKRLRGRIEQE